MKLINPPEEESPQEAAPVDSGLICLSAVCGYFFISVDPTQIAHELGLGAEKATSSDIIRAAKKMKLRGRLLRNIKFEQIAPAMLPAILPMKDGTYRLIVARREEQLIIHDPITRQTDNVSADEVRAMSTGDCLFVTRQIGSPGASRETFGLSWFLPSIMRYRKALANVLVASLLIQIFAIVTPIFFQVVIDKVLVHQTFATLVVIVVGLIATGMFEAVIQYLRTYALSHTTSRIDVELGARLVDHLFRLPLGYFESMSAGQIVARVRELETVRNFLTGPALNALLDLLFTIVLIAVLFSYPAKLTLIVIMAIPLFALVATIIMPRLQDGIETKFYHSAQSQQFLVESIVGVQTLKASAIEPMMQRQWEDRLAAYVKSAFDVLTIGAAGQSVIQLIIKIMTALVLFFGTISVINGELTVGGLIAFNMLVGQVVAPVIRLSQLWQDFQQVRVSLQRMGDILNVKTEATALTSAHLPPAKGQITMRDLSFRYRADGAPVLDNINLNIKAGEVIGIVGPSGSGKSTLTKLIQRLYTPERGQILVDGIDIAQVDPAWLRQQLGVVLQENLLFNRTVHENIALARPGLPRHHVIEAAKLAGADEFINTLPLGYDTVIEERGGNLSGGQRQRIAIARALVTNPRILILDEATSALDYESEHIIQRNMRAIARGRTVIIIAHRLSTVRQSDRIIGIAKGRIVEQGTHAELVTKPNGLYAHLWRLQTEGLDS